MRKQKLQHLNVCKERMVSCEWCDQYMKRRDLRGHTSRYCKEFKVKCKKCEDTYKRREKEQHDCIVHLKTSVKSIQMEMGYLKEQLTQTKKICDLQQEEILTLKQILLSSVKLDEPAKDFMLGFHDICNVIEFTEIQMNDENNNLSQQFSFSIKYQIKKTLPEKIMWRIYF